MKVYIAGPMAGIENLNYPAFVVAAKELRAAGFDVLSPHEIDEKYKNRAHFTDPEMEWLWYMLKCIPMVFEAQAIFLLEGWNNSRGAQIEWAIAAERNIPAYLYPSAEADKMIAMVSGLVQPSPATLQSSFGAKLG